MIGFDDIDVADGAGPDTVRQPLRETGARGVELLLSAIEGGAARRSRSVAPLAVIERRTT